MTKRSVGNNHSCLAQRNELAVADVLQFDRRALLAHQKPRNARGGESGGGIDLAIIDHDYEFASVPR